MPGVDGRGAICGDAASEAVAAAAAKPAIAAKSVAAGPADCRALASAAGCIAAVASLAAGTAARCVRGLEINGDSDKRHGASVGQAASVSRPAFAAEGALTGDGLATASVVWSGATAAAPSGGVSAITANAAWAPNGLIVRKRAGQCRLRMARRLDGEAPAVVKTGTLRAAARAARAAIAALGQASNRDKGASVRPSLATRAAARGPACPSVSAGMALGQI